MKKTFTIIILTYFLFTLNINRAFTQEAASQEENILKVGVLVPLKGAQKKIGKVVLNSVKLALQDIDWIIITKDNADEVFEKIKAGGGEYSLFALTDKGYEKLALNFADIRNKLAEQRQIILSYKDYYESE